MVAQKYVGDVGLPYPQLIGQHGTSKPLTSTVSSGPPSFTSLASVTFPDELARECMVNVNLITLPRTAAGLLTADWRGFVLVEYGSSGMQPSASLVDLQRGVNIPVVGSWIRASVWLQHPTAPGTPVTADVGAFITFGNMAQPEPYQWLGTNTGFVNPIAGGGTETIDLDAFQSSGFLRDIRLLTSDMANDTFRVEFRNRLGVTIFDCVKAPGEVMPWMPIPSEIGSLLITNLDPVNPIAIVRRQSHTG